MSKPSSDLRTIPVYSHQYSDGTGIEISYSYLLRSHRNPGLDDDPGGPAIALTGEDGTHTLAMNTDVGREIARAINEACDLAEAADEHGAAPDTVPAEWAE